jgi:hypothetical protein
MKPSEIRAGYRYKNKGAGRTERYVVQIGKHIEAPWFSGNKRPDEPVVQFVVKSGRVETLYLSSFASWAGSEVTP